VDDALVIDVKDLLAQDKSSSSTAPYWPGFRWFWLSETRMP